MKMGHGLYNMNEKAIIAELEKEIIKFRKDQSNENLTVLLNLLIKARLVVPCQMRVEPGYEDTINNLKKGDKLEDLDGVTFVAEILKASNGTKWIPYFTNPYQMPKNYLSQYSKMDYRFDEICNEQLINNEEINGIVINPFGESFYLDKQLLKFLFDVLQDNN